MASLGRGGLRALLRLRSEGLRLTGQAQRCGCCSMVDWNPADFRPKKAVVLTKVYRYEFEKMQHEKISEAELEEMLTKEMLAFFFFFGYRVLFQLCGELHWQYFETVW